MKLKDNGDSYYLLADGFVGKSLPLMFFIEG